MRITAKEKGMRFDGAFRQNYIETYTQPIHNYLAAWIYHYIWENLSWRIYRFFGMHQNMTIEDGTEVSIDVKQGLHCFNLSHKNRIVVNKKYDEPIFESPDV